MIKNKAIKALVIGACLVGSSMAGVYADENTPVTKPAIVDPAKEGSQVYTIQIESVKQETPQDKKQLEIDRYVFADHVKEMADKGITVTNTGVVGDYVEVGITPYTEENANYLYGIFGKDLIKVVEGQQAVALNTVSPAAEQAAALTSGPVQTTKEVQKPSIFTTIFSSIIEWFKSIF